MCCLKSAAGVFHLNKIRFFFSFVYFDEHTVLEAIHHVDRHYYVPVPIRPKDGPRQSSIYPNCAQQIQIRHHLTHHHYRLHRHQIQVPWKYQWTYQIYARKQPIQI